MIRVCLIDDQTLVRQGIRSLLDLGGVEVVAEAADGEAGLAAIRESRPDVVLLDLRMPKLDGLGVLRVLAEQADAPPVLILTTFDDDALVLEGLKAGARGYLLKDVTLEQLLTSVHTLAEGRSFVQPAVTDRLLKSLRTHGGEAPLEQPEPLTERETEVLRLLAGGYSNKEIARALELSEGTVKNHVSSILSKMGLRDRTRAVLKALELGLI